MGAAQIVEYGPPSVIQVANIYPEMTDDEKTHSHKKETEQPRVVIIGGGFGGLCAARGLAGAPVSVTLIDKRNYHLFRPMLYQVATGLLSADQIAFTRKV